MAIWTIGELTGQNRVGGIGGSGRIQGFAPGVNTYARQGGRTALRDRLTREGITDINQELVEAIALLVGQENTGEVLGILRLAGATSRALPGALQELAGFAENLELEAALVRFAEVYER